MKQPDCHMRGPASGVPRGCYDRAPFLPSKRGIRRLQRANIYTNRYAGILISARAFSINFFENLSGITPQGGSFAARIARNTVEVVSASPGCSGTE